ncbi:MAG: DUF4299 domain-containing protein [Bacilli bacterium]|nr:DUF4299 domain-containing protein [Bacilli bacterium]
MAVTVKIEPKKLFQKKLTIEEIIKLVNLDYGVSDEHYQLIENEIADHTLLYDKKKLARGIDLCLEGKEINLFLNLPTSKEEIRCFYDIIEKICKHLGTKIFIRDEEKVNITDKNLFIKYDEEGSIRGLEDLKEKMESNEYSGFQMFGVINPISIGKKELKKINNNLDNFASLLHELQSMDVYYANAHVYKVKDKLVGIYAIGPNIPSVVPIKPYIILDQIEGIEEWYVILKDGKTIKYDDFLKNAGKTKYYDDNHVIVNLNDKKIDELIAKYFIEV